MTRFLCIPAVLFGLMSPVWAHGPAPAAIGVALSHSDNGPQIIRLNTGLVYSVDGKWVYLCPVVWGGPSIPLATGAPDDDSAWLGAADGLQRVSTNGVISPAPFESELSSSILRKLVELNGVVYALSGFTGNSTLWRLDSTQATPIWEPDNVWSTLSSHGDTLVVAAALDSTLTLVTVTNPSADSPDITEVTIQSEILEKPFAGVNAVRSVNGSLFIRLYSKGMYSLHRVDDGALTELAVSKEPIHGPVLSADGATVFVAVDRNLSTLSGDDIVLVDETYRVTCLETDPFLGPYACALPNIRPISNDGEYGEPFYNIKETLPPVTDALSENTRLYCELEWMDFMTDAGIDQPTVEFPPESLSGTADPSEQSTGCNCQVRATKSGSKNRKWWIGVVLLLALLSWNRARCPERQ